MAFRGAFSGILALALCIVALCFSSLCRAASPWRIAPRPSWAEAIVVDATSSPATEDSALAHGREALLLQTDVRFEEAQILTYSHSATRIVSESGLQDAGLLSWNVDPSFEQLVFHSVVVRRGAESHSRLREENLRVTAGQGTLEHNLFAGIQTVALVLDDLRVGDIVEWEYTLKSLDPTLNGRVAFATALGSRSPVRHLKKRISAPPGRKLFWKVHLPVGINDALEPIVDRPSTGLVLSWERHNLQGLLQEVDTPPWYVDIPYVDVSEYATWKEVAESSLALYGKRAEPTPALQSLVKSWRSEGNSDSELVLRATRFVQEQIRYVGLELGLGRRRPSPAGEVLKRRYGDCKDKSVLLTALLRAAGIEAYPALVHSSQGRILSSLLPSPSVFDHVIVLAKPQGVAPLWIDATATHEGGSVDRYTHSPYGKALVLRADVQELESLPEQLPEANSFTLLETFRVALPTISVDAELDAERVYEAEQADRLREQLGRQKTEEIEKHFLGLYTRLFPRIEKRAPLEHSDDRKRNLVRVRLHYRIPGFWTWIEQEKQHRADLESSLAGELLTLPGPEPRRTPLQFVHPLLALHRMTVELPSEWTVAPEQGEESSPAFHFRYSKEYAAKRLELLWEVRSRQAFVTTEQLEQHRAAVEKARQHLVHSLTYHPAQPDTLHWQGLVGLAVLVVGIFYAAVRAWRWTPPPPASTLEPEPGLEKASLGIVLVGIRCALSPLALLRNLLALKWLLSKAQWELVLERMPEIRWRYVAVVCLETGFQVAAFAYTVLVLALFFRRKRSFPTHFVILNLAWPAWALVDAALTDLLDISTPGEGLLSAQSVAGVLISLLFVLYVRTSKRVALRFQS